MSIEDDQRGSGPIFILSKLADASQRFDRPFWQMDRELLADAISRQTLLVEVYNHGGLSTCRGSFGQGSALQGRTLLRSGFVPRCVRGGGSRVSGYR